MPIQQTEGFLRRDQEGGIVLHKSNIDAITNPLSTDDNSKGYGVFSIWRNRMLNLIWICIDAGINNAIWENIMTFNNTIRYENTTNLDAFARLRVSNPRTLFESKQIYDNQPLFWDEELETGAGIASVHTVDTASTVITSTLNTAGKFTRQTFRRFNYSPGKSQLIMMTGLLNRSGGGTGVQRRIGIFDDDNGLFFEDDEGTIKVVRRTNVTGTPADNKVAQSSWNLDKMDGAGSSGITIDWTKGQLFFIDFEWLAIGRARMCLIVGGSIIPVHQFLAANVLDKVYMSTPNLPLRFQIITTGSSPVSTMEAICASVISEGGETSVGVLRYISTDGTHLATTTENTAYALIGIRLKSTHLGSSIEIINTSIAEHAGSKNLEWFYVLNPTIGGSPSWSAETNSGIETFKGVAANTITGGTVQTGGYFSTDKKGGSEGGAIPNELILGAKIDGTVDELVLAVRPVGGSSVVNVEGSITWREQP